MLVLPIFEDQFDHAAKVQEKGLGLTLKLSLETKPEEIVDKLKQILKEKR